MTATAASSSASASAATATATAVATAAAAAGRLSAADSVDLGPVESFSDSSVKVVFCSAVYVSIQCAWIAAGSCE